MLHELSKGKHGASSEEVLAWFCLLLAWFCLALAFTINHNDCSRNFPCANCLGEEPGGFALPCAWSSSARDTSRRGGCSDPTQLKCVQKVGYHLPGRRCNSHPRPILRCISGPPASFTTTEHADEGGFSAHNPPHPRVPSCCDDIHVREDAQARGVHNLRGGTTISSTRNVPRTGPPSLLTSLLNPLY